MESGLVIQLLLDRGRHERAVDEPSFDPLFEFRWYLLRFDIQSSFPIYPLFKLFDREQLSRIAVNEAFLRQERKSAGLKSNQGLGCLWVDLLVVMEPFLYLRCDDAKQKKCTRVYRYG